MPAKVAPANWNCRREPTGRDPGRLQMCASARNARRSADYALTAVLDCGPRAIEEPVTVRWNTLRQYAFWPLLCAAPLAFAQDQDPLNSPQNERVRLSAGIFSGTTATDLRLDSNAGIVGTEINAEEDLGLREKGEMGNVEAEIRIRERHRLRFNYFISNRHATKALEREIDFGENTYNVGDIVDSKLDMRVFGTTYTYEAYRSDRATVGLSFGINLVEAQADAEVDARDIDENDSRAGPFPSIGVNTLIRITRRFHFEARAEYMDVGSGDVEGTYTDLDGAILFRMTRNLAFGAGYGRMVWEIVSTDIDDSGRFRIDNSGPRLFMRVAF